MAENSNDITTNTIADLYIKQGYYDKALDIYRTILEIEPSNEGASAKIKEIEAMVAGSQENEREPEEVPVETPSGPIAVESQVARLESWLSTIQEMRGKN